MCVVFEVARLFVCLCICVCIFVLFWVVANLFVYSNKAISVRQPRLCVSTKSHMRYQGMCEVLRLFM